MKKQKILMMKGLPASWKSTFTVDFIKKNQSFIRINNDDLRKSINGWVFTKAHETMITAIRRNLIELYLWQGYSIIVDNTNLNPIHEEELRDIASAWLIDLEIKDMNVDVETCVARDKLRWEDKVGEKVIRDMSNKWNYNPAPPREFDIIKQDVSLPKAFVFDIDGTLAYMNGRNPYDFSRVHEDGVHEDVRTMLLNLIPSGYRIFIVSWRGEECSKETMKWLDDNDIPYTDLFMRKEGDKRKDTIIKYEILKNDITPNYYIQWIFDDRDCVVKMAREAGFRVYQVNYGNF